MQQELSDDELKQLEWLLVDFDDGWHTGRLAEQLAILPRTSSIRQRALAEMIKIDLERQWSVGRHATIGSYLIDYPELGTLDSVSAELIQAEIQVRRQFGQPADLDDYCRRFPRQAAELRRLIERAKLVVSDFEMLATGPSMVTSSTLKDDGRPAPVRRPEEKPPSGAANDTADVAVSGCQLPREFGRYRILKNLGEGAMGAVYLTHDKQLDRQVAIRIPRFAQEAGTELLAQLYCDVRAAATIQHPNICPIYDIGRTDGIHYVAMAYNDGQPLSNYALALGPIEPDCPVNTLPSDSCRDIPLQQVVAIIRTLALALQHAHDLGVVHGDLKTKNIMINRDHDLMIMDFGLARGIL